MKNILSGRVGTLCCVLLMVALGTALIVREVTYISDRLRAQQDMVDMMSFNQQLMDNTYNLQRKLDSADVKIYQMDLFIQQLYNQLRKYNPNLPGLPRPEEDREGNDA